MGTPSYMSPEQAEGRPVDKRADVWSFGVVLYEMLTGRRLFDGKSDAHVLVHVMEQEPDWSKLPPLPSGVQSLMERCLQKDPAQRLRDIGDVHLLLQASLSRPVRAADAAARPAPASRRWLWLAPRPVPRPSQSRSVRSSGLVRYLSSRPTPCGSTSSGSRASRRRSWPSRRTDGDWCSVQRGPTVPPSCGCARWRLRNRGRSKPRFRLTAYPSGRPTAGTSCSPRKASSEKSMPPADPPSCSPTCQHK